MDEQNKIIEWLTQKTENDLISWCNFSNNPLYFRYSINDKTFFSMAQGVLKFNDRIICDDLKLTQILFDAILSQQLKIKEKTIKSACIDAINSLPFS